MILIPEAYPSVPIPKFKRQIIFVPYFHLDPTTSKLDQTIAYSFFPILNHQKKIFYTH